MEDDIIATIAADAEEIVHFPAKPGGLVDRHRQEKARREAAEKQREQEAELEQEPSYKAVKVIILSPEVVSGNTFNFAVGASPGMILPNMEYRYAATIMLMPIAGQTPTVILAKDS